MLASALDAVLTLRRREEWKESDDPLADIVVHEIKGWFMVLADSIGTSGALAGSTGERVADGLLLVPTLARRRDRPELTALLTSVRGRAFPDQPPVNAIAVQACLRTLYPAEEADHVAPLEPDRLGEILVRRVLAEPQSSGDNVGYLGAVLDASPSGTSRRGPGPCWTPSTCWPAPGAARPWAGSRTIRRTRFSTGRSPGW